MPAKMDTLQARVREMEGVAYGRDERTESWMNTWAFQARRELRRRRRRTRAARAAATAREQPSGST
jgi:hypothetical protein